MLVEIFCLSSSYHWSQFEDGNLWLMSLYRGRNSMAFWVYQGGEYDPGIQKIYFINDAIHQYELHR